MTDSIQRRWKIEAPRSSLSDDLDTGTLVLRLGIAVNAIRAAQRFYAAADAPGPGGERDRFWAFLIAAGFLNEALQVLRPSFPRVRALAEAGGVASSDIRNASELLSGRRPINQLLDHLRNRLVFHWDDGPIREFAARYSRETVVWGEGVGDSNGEMLYRASADSLCNSVLPDEPDRDVPPVNEGLERVRNLIREVTAATRSVLGVFEHAITGYLSASGARIVDVAD